jgi:hypothetical protein
MKRRSCWIASGAPARLCDAHQDQVERSQVRLKLVRPARAD